MYKRINLLSADLMPPVLRLPLERVVQTCSGLLLVSVLSYSGLALKNWFDEQSLLQLKMDQQSLLLQKQAYEAQVQAHKADEALIRQVNAMTQRITLKSQLLSEVERRGFASNPGFSPLLRDLSTAAIDDLWLHRIQVRQQDFSFEGYSLKPDLVPKWVEQLKSAETLKGYSFSAMTMQASEQNTTQFHLKSALKEDAPTLEDL